MSGLEIIGTLPSFELKAVMIDISDKIWAPGVALTLPPLIIAGLQLYHKGSEECKYFKEYQNKIQGLQFSVRSFQTHFESTLSRLLADFVSTNQELRLLLEHPCGLAWENPKLAAYLDTRLGTSRPLCFELVAIIVDELKSLKTSIGLDDRDEVKMPG